MFRDQTDKQLKYARIMAKYFGNLVPSEVHLEQHIGTQPLELNDYKLFSSQASINIRRCVEASQHMVDAKMYKEAIST